MECPTSAETVARLLPPERLHPRAWKAAQVSAEKRERWLVALSGGADSVALLLLIWAHFPEQRGALIAVHFNHRLRGRESDLDESFCRDLCEGLGVPLRVGAWSDPPVKATEDDARRA